ncbi:MAG TPA: cell division protein FtsL [Candidatus Xenobia bacterium]|jgi:cell division protein FtsL
MPLAAEKLIDPAVVRSRPMPEPPPVVEKERERKSAGGFFLWLYPTVAVSCMALLLVGLLCQSAKIVGLQYKMVQLKEKKSALLRERTDLTLEVQELTSLSRIEAVARGRLGMVLPRQRLVLDLSDSMPQQALLRNAVAARHP